jgi:hypothetical protein
VILLFLNSLFQFFIMNITLVPSNGVGIRIDREHLRQSGTLNGICTGRGLNGQHARSDQDTRIELAYIEWNILRKVADWLQVILYFIKNLNISVI